MRPVRQSNVPSLSARISQRRQRQWELRCALSGGARSALVGSQRATTTGSTIFSPMGSNSLASMITNPRLVDICFDGRCRGSYPWYKATQVNRMRLIWSRSTRGRSAIVRLAENLLVSIFDLFVKPATSDQQRLRQRLASELRCPATNVGAVVRRSSSARRAASWPSALRLATLCISCAGYR